MLKMFADRFGYLIDQLLREADDENAEDFFPEYFETAGKKRGVRSR